MTDPTPTPPALDLAALTVIAKAATPGPWEVWANTHCDPVVIPAGGTRFKAITDPNMPFQRITGLSTGPSGYGRANLNYVAAFDPPTVLALIALAEKWEGLAEEAAGKLVDAIARAEAAERAAATSHRDYVDTARRAQEEINRAEAAEAKIAAVRELHAKTDVEVWGHGMEGPVSHIEWRCIHCESYEQEDVRYPCPTIAALDGPA